MGHLRLKRIPSTHAWDEVVGMMGDNSDVEEIAAASARAMRRALDKALSDPALIHTIYLLANITTAARSRDVPGALRGLGIEIGRTFDLSDLIAGISTAVDRDARRRGNRTDLGEMALHAAASSLARVLAPSLPNLIGPSQKDLVAALAKLGTPIRFAELSRAFYGDLIRRGLEYYTSRIHAQFVGRGRRFESLDSLERFRSALALHCSERTRILEQYSAAW